MLILKPAKQYRCLVISIFLLSFFFFLAPAVKAQSGYSETIFVLQARYKDEIQALHNYRTYAEKAAAEKYPNIAKLFMTLAASETVHAGNFETLLSALGENVEKLPQSRAFEKNSIRDGYIFWAAHASVNDIEIKSKI